MLFFIITSLLIISIIWGIKSDWWSDAALVFTVIFAIVELIMIICLCCNWFTVDATVERNKIRYETLVYQYENNVYDNDNDLGKRELIVDIQKWNEDLAYNQSIQDDFWIGIFYPNIYDQFEFIDLESSKG